MHEAGTSVIHNVHMSFWQALRAARDPLPGVRNIAGIVITTVATNFVKAGAGLGR